MTAVKQSAAMSRRSVLRCAMAAAVGAPAFGNVFAQADVGHLILGFPAGAGLDPPARMIAERLRGSYLPNLIVENRAGAGGRIAVESMKRAPKDGTHFLITPASPLVLAPYTQKVLPYDPVKDLVPVTMLVNYRMGLQVGPGAAGVKTIADYLAWIRKDPANTAFGTPGIGTMQQFLGSMFAQAVGVRMTHVAYRGAPPLYQDLLGGQVPAVFTPVSGDSVERHRASTTRFLAIASPARAKELPDVPTFVELGFNDLLLSEWIGAFVPAGTPSDVVEKLGRSLRSAIASPEITNWASRGGQEIVTSTSSELRARMLNDMMYWKKLAADSGFNAME